MAKSTKIVKSKITRHPLAIAWDEWLASGEGREASMAWSGGAGDGEYLRNRLHRSFNAGAKAAESSLAEKVLAEIDVVAENAALVRRLRELFTKMGIEIKEK